MATATMRAMNTPGPPPPTLAAGKTSVMTDIVTRPVMMSPKMMSPVRSMNTKALGARRRLARSMPPTPAARA